MTELETLSRREAGKLIRSVLVCIPFFALTILLSADKLLHRNMIDIVSSMITVLFTSTMFFLMVNTKKTDRYRTILFIVLGICFILSFSAEFYEVHGRFMVYTTGDAISSNLSYCPIAIPNTIATMILGKTLIFASNIGHTLMMLLIMTGIIIFGGRSWCGWHCFFAGVEEGMSRCRKKPLKKVNRKWVYFSFAMLLIVLIVSPIILSPIYCDWLCPLKAISEYEQIESIRTVLKTIVFLLLFLILVILVPLFTSKRGQCAFFCPLGALLSMANKISPFEIVIERSRCINCKKCINSCPTYALDEESLKKGKTCINCYKCGKCTDLCPVNAISYHIKGTKVSLKSSTARIMFLYPTMLFYFLMGGAMITDAIRRILLLITTGSMIG